MNQMELSSRSPLLSEAERQKLLVEWNATEIELPKATSIHELIERQSAESPEAIALICRDEKLTYSELNTRSNWLASDLYKLGVGPETLVGICVERSVEMVVGLLAILKSGGAYVPLDPTYPQERLAFMLEDSKLSVLLTQEKLVEDRGWRVDDGDPRSSTRNPLSSILYPRLKIVHLDRVAA